MSPFPWEASVISGAASQQKSAPVDRTLALPSGAMRARCHGPVAGPLALGVPGLSANALSFDALGAPLAQVGITLVAVDLRGRGRSPPGALGTHGWENHARDVLAAATALGVECFDFIGHSMGAFVGLALANLSPQRLRRLVLIDAVGVPDPRAMPPIVAAVTRLGTVYPSADAFLAMVAGSGAVPWSPFWEAHYREDLVEVSGGVRQRAAPQAVLEDLMYGTQQLSVRTLWSGVRAQALLVRAGLPIGDGGHIVTEADRDSFLSAVQGAQTVEVPANHYGVMNHVKTATAIKEFLR
jgi:pimeloyl-ACP methyl ester carboxylesterase